MAERVGLRVARGSGLARIDGGNGRPRSLMNDRNGIEDIGRLIQADPLCMLGFQRVLFQQPVRVADAATVLLQDDGPTPERAQLRWTACCQQPRVRLGGIAELHSFARFTGHGESVGALQND